jgi:hypothetical protein
MTKRTGDPKYDFIRRLFTDAELRAEFRAAPQETAARAGAQLSDAELEKLTSDFGDEDRYQEIVRNNRWKPRLPWRR